MAKTRGIYILWSWGEGFGFSGENNLKRGKGKRRKLHYKRVKMTDNCIFCGNELLNIFAGGGGDLNPLLSKVGEEGKGDHCTIYTPGHKQNEIYKLIVYLYKI